MGHHGIEWAFTQIYKKDIKTKSPKEIFSITLAHADFPLCFHILHSKFDKTSCSLRSRVAFKDRQQEAKRDLRYLTLLPGYVLQSIMPYTK